MKAFAPVALLTLSVLPAAQQATFPTYSAETYGGVSGDTPLRALGLVLELVGGNTADPALRLFGGPPGQAATILVGGAPAATPGPGGRIELVAGPLVAFEGAFDWMGYYEVPLSAIAELQPGMSLYAQGVHAGIFDLGPTGEPLTQLSNGLVVAPTVADDQPLGFDELLPHLPPITGPLPPTISLAERLQVYLNSPGDSTKIKVHFDLSGGEGANVGGQLEAEFEIQRTPEGFYDMSLAGDVAAKAGVEVTQGVEANATGGYGAKRVFRFYSAPGVARGILGLAMSLRFPSLTPGRWLANSGLLPDPEAAVQLLRDAVRFAQDNADVAEAFLWDVLAAQVARAESQRDAVRGALRYAQHRLAHASWNERPFWRWQVCLWNAAYAVTQANVFVCRFALEKGQLVVQAAKAFVEERQAELRAVLAELSRLPRIVAAVAQLRGYTTDHYLGTEVRFKQSASAQLELPVPVKVADLDVGAERQIEMTVAARYEKASGTTPARFVLERQLEDKTDASLGLGVLGLGAERKRTGALVETFDLDGGLHHTTEVKLARDVRANASGALTIKSVVGGGQVGVGRKSSLKLARDFTITPDFQLGAFLLGENRDRLGDTEVGFELQDRLVREIELEVGLSIAGNGGSFKIDIEWNDQGRLLARSTTIGEAIAQVMDGVDRLPDPDTGMVLEP